MQQFHILPILFSAILVITACGKDKSQANNQGPQLEQPKTSSTADHAAQSKQETDKKGANS